MATQPEELYDFAGLPRMGLMDLFKSIASGTSGRDVGRMREKRKNFAQDMARKKALQEAIADPSLKVTAEERALTEADIARQLNEQAARDEMAADRAAVNRDLARPFPSVNPNPKPQGVMDMENALYGSMYESQTPPPPPPPKEISEEQRKFRESFALPAPSKSDLKEEPDMADPIVQNIANMLNPPEIKSVSGGPTSGRGAVQDPGFLSRAGRGILDYLSDPVNRKSLAIGFNAMTLNPDRGFQAAMQSQIENIQEQRLAAKAGNQTADYLERQGLFAEAELIRANPELASDILSSTTLGASSDYQKKLEEIVAQDDRDLVNNATDQVANREKTISTLQKLENDEAFTGALVPIQTTLGRVLESLGVEATDKGALGEFLQKSSNTELLRARLGRTVFEAIGELGIGARGLDTPAERKFLIEVMAGTPESTKAFLQELLQDRLRQQEISIEEYNKALKEGRLDRFQRYAKRDLSPIQLDPYGDEFAEFEIVN